MKNKNLRSGFIIFIAWALMTVPSIAQIEKSQKPKQDNEPLEITSDRMRSENGGVKIIFSGNVVSYKGDLKITSDMLEVYNSEDTKETDEIVAIGNVFITRGLKKATGDKAVYIDKLQKIILTGTPKATAWEEDSMIEGREMIFLLEKDRFVVNERVRMKMYPKDKEDNLPSPNNKVAGLRTENLVKSYRTRKVVKKVSIEVNQGEIVGLLGPNGAGKTTTFYMVVGLTRPDEGKVLLNDEDVTCLPMHQRAKKGVSYLPQEPSVFRKLTVEDNIIAVLESQKLTRFDRKKKARALLRELNILHIKDSKAYSLSGGERRRVEISRALATSPVFILLDEPFAGIDPIAVADIQSIISQLKKKGIGVLITDHNVRETLSITDRAYIINDGQIIASGKPMDVAQDEKVKQIYLGNQFSF